MLTSSASTNYILGIDLGSNSVGWAMIGLSQEKPAGLLRAGVRVFDAGMERNQGKPAETESAVGLITAHGA